MTRSATDPVHLEQALALAAELAPRPGIEDVQVGSATGRVLAVDARAAGDIPAFPNSALDGYALRAGDTPGALHIAGESRAGAAPPPLAPGEAVVISTGAPLPQGADAILRVEDTQVRDGVLHVAAPLAAGTGVRPAAGDLVAGAVLLPAGHQVRPHEVTLLAGAGLPTVKCLAPRGVAVVVTGDEVVSAGRELGPGQVWDAASDGVAAVLRAADGLVVHVGHAPDDAAATNEAIGHALDARPHVLVTVGGVSVGRHDHVRAALEHHGLRVACHGVRARPGQPALLGQVGDVAVLGLPGNPVSAAVVSHVLGRPLLGHAPGWARRLPLAADHRGPDMPRVDLLRCRLDDGGLVPMPLQESHNISSLAHADVLAWLPPHSPHVPAGTLLRVDPLPA